MNKNAVVKIWRGTRQTFNALTQAQKDYWTRYSVLEADGTWTEYYGVNPIFEKTGEGIRVKSIVTSVPTDIQAGDRYILNNSGSYSIIEGGINGTSTVLPMSYRTVRVEDRNMHTYGLVEGVLTEFDENFIEDVTAVANEHNQEILRKSDGIYMPAIGSSSASVSVVANTGRTSTQCTQCYIDEINGAAERQAIETISGSEMRGYFNDYFGKTWFSCEGADITMGDDINEFVLNVSSFFSVRGDTNKIARNYPSHIITMKAYDASNNLLDSSSVSCKGYAEGEDPKTAVEYQNLSVHSNTPISRVEISAVSTEDEDTRFLIFDTSLVFNGGSTEYVWRKVAWDEDVQALFVRVSNIEAAVSANTNNIAIMAEELEELEDFVGDIQIYKVDRLPMAEIGQVDKLYKVGDEIYQCVSEGGVAVGYDMTSVTSGSTSPITTPEGWKSKMQPVTNNFNKDFSADTITSVYTDDAGFHIGKSGTAGSITLVYNNTRGEEPLTDLLFRLKPWMESKNSGLIYSINGGELTGQTVVDCTGTIPQELYINAESIGGIEDITLTSFQPDPVMNPETEQNVYGDVRCKVTEIITGYYGGAPEYGWKKIGGNEVVTVFTSGVTDEQVPSAKLVYDTFKEDEEIIANALNDLETRKEDKSNKIQVITETSTDEEYPSAKAVYDAIQVSGGNEVITVFTSGVTDEQVPSAKLVYDTVAEIEDVVATSLTDLEGRKENVTNKVTELSEDNTDEQYPSAKAVYDVIIENEEITAAGMAQLDRDIKALEQTVTDDEEVTSTALNKLNDEKEDKANKVTELSEDNTDDQYPSAKAVVTEMIKNERTIAAAINKLHNEKQPMLVSGENIKTINGLDITGAGNIAIESDLQYVITGHLPIPSSATEGKLYLLVYSETGDDRCIEYITVNEEGTYRWEMVGSASQDLSNYVTLNGTQTITGSKTFSNGVTASSFVKSGGSSTQVLKADGSVGNILTAITSASTNSDIPGAKLVYDALAEDEYVLTQLSLDKQDKSNLTTVLTSASTDTQYPSAKAVYDVIVDDEEAISAALNDLNLGKQEKLISGETLKTINGQNLLGSGNIVIQGGGESIEVVDNLTSTSATDALSANMGRELNATKQATLVSGTNIKTVNNQSLLGSGNITITGSSVTVVNNLTSTSATNALSANMGRELNATKQATLVSGTNIKTVNGESLLGSGDITITGSSVTVVDNLTSTSATDALSANMGKTLNDTKEDVSNKVTELSEDNTDDQYPSAKAVWTELEKKVDKVEGKGLSTNDFTDVNKNSVELWLSNPYPVPTGSELDNWVETTLLGTYADGQTPMFHKATSSNAGLMTSADKVKLDALPSTAIPTSEKGTANGVATLDSNGRVLTSQLPASIDEIVEGSSMSAFPATGESEKIYVALDTNKCYRWGGSAYVEISASLALGNTSSTAFRGDLGSAAYQHSLATSGNPHNVTKADLGLGNVENASVAAIRSGVTKTSLGIEKVENVSVADIRSGVTKSSIGLSNVENVSVADIRSGVTKTSLGLGNVENVSVADIRSGVTPTMIGLGKVANATPDEIRSGITSANVTTALGYIPVGMFDVGATGTGSIGPDENGSIDIALFSEINGNNCDVKLSMDGDNYKECAATISAATTSSPGVMTAAQVSRLNNTITGSSVTSVSSSSTDSQYPTAKAVYNATSAVTRNQLTGITGYSATKNLVLTCQNGVLQWVEFSKVLSGTDAPDSSQGTNGDIYLQTD